MNKIYIYIYKTWGLEKRERQQQQQQQAQKTKRKLGFTPFSPSSNLLPPPIFIYSLLFFKRGTPKKL